MSLETQQVMQTFLKEKKNDFPRMSVPAYNQSFVWFFGFLTFHPQSRSPTITGNKGTKILVVVD